MSDLYDIDPREAFECCSDYEEDDLETFNRNEADDYRDEGDEDFEDFADPGGNSALRAATASNPRNLPCPTCGTAGRLTPKDVALGYQCDACADRDERGGY